MPQPDALEPAPGHRFASVAPAEQAPFAPSVDLDGPRHRPVQSHQGDVGHRRSSRVSPTVPPQAGIGPVIQRICPCRYARPVPGASPLHRPPTASIPPLAPARGVNGRSLAHSASSPPLERRGSTSGDLLALPLTRRRRARRGGRPRGCGARGRRRCGRRRARGRRRGRARRARCGRGRRRGCARRVGRGRRRRGRGRRRRGRGRGPGRVRGGRGRARRIGLQAAGLERGVDLLLHGADLGRHRGRCPIGTQRWQRIQLLQVSRSACRAAAARAVPSASPRSGRPAQWSHRPGSRS